MYYKITQNGITQINNHIKTSDFSGSSMFEYVRGKLIKKRKTPKTGHNFVYMQFGGEANGIESPQTAHTRPDVMHNKGANEYGKIPRPIPI